MAQAIEVDVASQGDTFEEALANIQEALELYFEDGAQWPEVAPIIATVDVPIAG